MLKLTLRAFKVNKKTLILFLIFFLFSINLFAGERVINISSNKLKIDMNQRKSTFIENVYAYNDKIKVWSEEMIVNLEKNNDEIKEIIASGNIRIVRLINGSEIYGDTASYFLKEEKIIVIGNVLVKENENQISGNKLTVDLKNSTSIMLGSNSNQVEALIGNN